MCGLRPSLLLSLLLIFICFSFIYYYPSLSRYFISFLLIVLNHCFKHLYAFYGLFLLIALSTCMRFIDCCQSLL